MRRRAARWWMAAVIGSAMTTVGCVQSMTADEAARPPRPLVADEGLVHAFDTQLDMRVIDRLELDHRLRDRNIRIEAVDGEVTLTGDVWTMQEKARAGELARRVPGVIDVANELDVRPPQ